jgi:hypothetical protein
MKLPSIKDSKIVMSPFVLNLVAVSLLIGLSTPLRAQSQGNDFIEDLKRYGTLKNASTSTTQTQDWAYLANRFHVHQEQAPNREWAIALEAESLWLSGQTDMASARIRELDINRIPPLLREWVSLQSFSPWQNTTARTNSPLALSLLKQDVVKNGLDPFAFIRKYKGSQVSEALLGQYLESNPEDLGHQIRFFTETTTQKSKVATQLYQNRASLSPELKYQLAEYFFLKSPDYQKAAVLYGYFNTPSAHYSRGRALWGLNRLDEAKKALNQSIGPSTINGKAYFTLGRIEAQQGRYTHAAQMYEKSYKYGGSTASSALWRWSRVAKEQNSFQLQSTLIEKLLKQYPRSEEAASIAYDRFWTRYRRGEYALAKRDAEHLGSNQPGTENAASALYWTGRILESSDVQAADNIYEKIKTNKPFSYYAWRSEGRQLALRGEADPGFNTQDTVGAAVDVPDWDYGQLLDNGGADFNKRALPEAVMGLNSELKTLIYYRQTDLIQTLPSEAQSWVHQINQRYFDSIRLTRDDGYLDYPLGYSEYLVPSAQTQGVSPFLLAGLIRQESRFDRYAKSWVGATGLGQMMDFTAAWVRKQVPETMGKPLTDPETNLKLSAWYLSFTHRQFNGDSMKAVASYNAGPGAVAKWSKTFPQEPDAFVESIPYSETKDYVKRVFQNYWNYKRLYLKR